MFPFSGFRTQRLLQLPSVRRRLSESPLARQLFGMVGYAEWVEGGYSTPVNHHARPGQEPSGALAIGRSFGHLQVLKRAGQHTHREMTVRPERLITRFARASAPLRTA